MTEFDGLPVLRSPVAIAAFEGWNDAADASTAAVEHLEQVWEAREIAAIDPEEFYDFQVNRPTITLAEGETRRIEWPTTRFMVASPPGTERDVVLIRGIEPSMRWRTFCEEVLEVCHSLEVEPGRAARRAAGRRAVHPAAADQRQRLRARPRPSGTSSPRPGTRARPASSACCTTPARRAEVDAVSFWVHVPHYANNPPCPKATLALLHRVEEVLDLPVPMADLAEESAEWEERVRSRRRAGRRARRVRPRAGGARRRRRHQAADRRRDRPASSRSTCAAAAARPAPPPAPGSAASRDCSRWRPPTVCRGEADFA